MKELILQIEVLDHALDVFPITDKRGLLRGSIDYCAIALKKMILEGCNDSLIICNLRNLYEKANAIFVKSKDMQLDFDADVYDKFFEELQEFCSTHNILPILDNLTLREVLKINRAYKELENK